MNDIIAKIIRNKRNNQLLIHLSRKKLALLKKDPKYIKINKEDLVY